MEDEPSKHYHTTRYLYTSTVDSSLIQRTIILSCFVIQISYASTSATLSNKSLFPNFFRTVPSDESLPPALATVMQYYGWRQVAIVTERESQFLQLLPLLNSSFSQEGISVDYFIVEGRTDTIFVSAYTSSTYSGTSIANYWDSLVS